MDLKDWSKLHQFWKWTHRMIQGTVQSEIVIGFFVSYNRGKFSLLGAKQNFEIVKYRFGDKLKRNKSSTNGVAYLTR